MKKYFFVLLFSLPITLLSQEEQLSSFKDSLDNALKKAKNKREKLNILNKSTSKIYKKLNYEESLPYFQTLARISRELNKPIINAKALRYLSEIAYTKGDVKKALKYSDSLLIINENNKIKDCSYLLNLNQAGRMYMEDLKERKSIQIYKKGITDYWKNKCPDDYLFLLSNIGIAYNYLGILDSAMFYNLKTARLADSLGDFDSKSQAYYNIGSIYKKHKDYQQAEKYFLKAIEDSSKISERYIYKTYKELGAIYPSMKKYELALKYNKLAYNYYKKIGHNLFALIILNEISGMFEKKGDKEMALLYADKALEEAKKIPDPLYFTGVLFTKAYILLEMNKIKEAEKVINQIMEEKEGLARLGSDGKIHLYEKLYLLNKKKKNFKEALKYHEIFTDLYDSIINLQKQKNFSELEVKYQTEKKEKEILQLQNETKSKQLALEKNSKKIWILGITLSAVLLFFILLGFFYYKLKQKKNIIELLQRDLHHRVKNNLSIISAFVDDLLEKINDPELKTKLIDLNNRIQSINELHRQLYKDVDITGMSMRKYVDKIARMVQSSYGNENIEVKNLIDNNVKIDPNRASLLGLVINEFITNSFKHAFEKFQKGKIFIELIKKDAKYILRMKDNGAGLPDDFHQKSQVSFGMDIFNLIAKQLNGKMHLSGKNGVELIIEFTA